MHLFKKNQRFVIGYAGALLLSVAVTFPTQAAITDFEITVDADPTASGVQSTRTVTQGTTFEVDVLAAGLDDITGFATEVGAGGIIGDGVPSPLLFDDGLLTGQSVSGGSLLPGPFGVSNEGISGGQAYFNRVPTGANTASFPASGEGILFSVLFEATNLGISDLTFVDSQPYRTFDLLDDQDNSNASLFTEPVSTGASITVAVPEPSTAALVGAGVLLLIPRRRRQTPRP